VTETTSPPPAKAPGLAKAYLILAIVTTVVIVVQFFLAGLGTFHDIHTGETSSFKAHEQVGYAIALLSLILLIITLLGRMGGKAIGMTATLLILAGPVQPILANAGVDHSEIWGALHAFVGASMLGLCFTLIRIGTTKP
jgi:hypothetical protein